MVEKKWIIRILFAIVTFWFIFALLSGAEPGFMGLLKNIPNSLPWLLLFGLVYLAEKYPKKAGISIMVLGMLSAFLFDAFESPFVLIAISIPLTTLGYFLWK